MDETDKQIMRELLANSRLSFREIAKRIRVSPVTVLTRIKKLESNGIIKYYATILDHEKLGYDLSAIIELNISKGKLIDIEEEIAKSMNVLGVYDITGASDAIILAKFKTRRELNSFIKKILKMPFVERTNTRVILNTIKEDFRLL
ncbi:MAG: Lrp/AsnC family transcriptional regulator [Candidatus Aenigmarchaeota archaeon]|nr:Lrp/AsnC family transcriptional regulator [Candidatus Aenigmarchaeota archaeon]